MNSTSLIMQTIYLSLQDSIVPHLNSNFSLNLIGDLPSTHFGGSVELHKYDLIFDNAGRSTYDVVVQITQYESLNNSILVWVDDGTEYIQIKPNNPQLIEMITTIVWNAYNGIYPKIPY